MCIADIDNVVDQDHHEDQDADDADDADDAEDYDWDDENLMTMRAKWSLDDCATLDEVVEQLQHLIEYYKTLKNEGWELESPIRDDYGFLRKSPSESTN